MGTFLDETDGITVLTALTIANTDIKLHKLNATSEVNKNSGGATHIAGGRYYITLNSTDSDTIGRMDINIHIAGALPVKRECFVFHPDIYDRDYATSPTNLIESNVVQWNDVALATTNPLPNVAAGANGGLPLGDASGRVLLQPTQTGVTIPSVTLVATTTTLTNLPAITANWITGTGIDASAVTKLQNGLATSTEVTSIQNNTRVVRVVPSVVERPDSGTVTYRIELLLYDTVGNMEAPDSAPTLALVDQGGTDLSARLDSTTGSLVSTGRYRWVYTASSTDELEQLIWTFSVVEGGNTRLYGNTTLIVDTTSVDFTSADRTKLDTIHTRMDAAITTRQSTFTDDTNVNFPVNFEEMIIDGDGLIQSNVMEVNGTDQTAGDIVALINAFDPTSGGGDCPTLEEIVEGVNDEIDIRHGVGSYGNTSTGTGARTVTITVVSSESGNDPLENVKVRLTQSNLTYAFGTTDENGEIVLQVDDGTYNVSITKPMYQVTGVISLLVNGNETVEYEMDQIIPTISEMGYVTGYATVLGVNGLPESGVVIKCQVKYVPPTVTGYILDDAVRIDTSDESGYIEFTNLVPGVTYEFKRGNRRRGFDVIIPDSDFDIPGFNGNP